MTATFFHDSKNHEKNATLPNLTARLTSNVHTNVLVPLTLFHYRFLLEIHFDWLSSLEEGERLFGIIRDFLGGDETKRTAIEADFEIFDATCPDKSGHKNYFRWRETDFFLQNITAIQLGLSEFRQREDIGTDNRSLTVVGLAYGGIELPAIAQVVGKVRQLNIKSALAHISHYGNEEVQKQLIHGGADYVTGILKKSKPLLFFGDENVDQSPESVTQVVILDDNSTTGLTLQLARDYLVSKGFDVVGVILVRFPGANRFVHMMIDELGGTHPEILFNFVRGLVGPSPYTRLLFEGTAKFKNSEGQFDKAKERIRSYLKLNGNAT